MNILPKIEKVTRDAALSYFLLMFGYKLFSLYFPLFLISKHFSFAQVGYSYFLIYLPLAIFSPLAGFILHKINSAHLTVAGILGYAVYSLGVIFIQNQILFYLLQIWLGLAAALFYTSLRAIMMSADLEKPNRSFAWFYSAANYAQVVAPAVGAIAIWKFDFAGVFALSVIVYLANAVFSFSRLNGHIKSSPQSARFQSINAPDYKKVFGLLKNQNIFPLLAVSFAIVLLSGFYQAFFILFLKNNLAWSQNEILFLNSVLSLVFLPISILVIKFVDKFPGEKNILRGGAVSGFFSVLLGLGGAVLNFLSIFAIQTANSIGNLVSDSGRSGLLAQKLKIYSREAGAIDTIFSPLGTALGALVGGVIVSRLGYPNIFIAGGIFVAALSLAIGFCQKNSGK